MTYEEIVAMATYNNIITELNSAPLEYYNKFNNEWHIIDYSMYNNNYLLSNNWSRTVVDSYFYFYDADYNTWHYNMAWGPE